MEARGPSEGSTELQLPWVKQQLTDETPARCSLRRKSSASDLPDVEPSKEAMPSARGTRASGRTKPLQKFERGCRVRHRKHGLGTVVDISAFANGTPMTVVKYDSGESHRYRPDSVYKLFLVDSAAKVAEAPFPGSRVLEEAFQRARLAARATLKQGDDPLAFLSGYDWSGGGVEKRTSWLLTVPKSQQPVALPQPKPQPKPAPKPAPSRPAAQGVRPAAPHPSASPVPTGGHVVSAAGAEGAAATPDPSEPRPAAAPSDATAPTRRSASFRRESQLAEISLHLVAEAQNRRESLAPPSAAGATAVAAAGVAPGARQRSGAEATAEDGAPPAAPGEAESGAGRFSWRRQQLEQLADLLESGAITPEEHELWTSRVTGGHPAASPQRRWGAGKHPLFACHLVLADDRFRIQWAEAVVPGALAAFEPAVPATPAAVSAAGSAQPLPTQHGPVGGSLQRYCAGWVAFVHLAATQGGRLHVLAEDERRRLALFVARSGGVGRLSVKKLVVGDTFPNAATALAVAATPIQPRVVELEAGVGGGMDLPRFMLTGARFGAAAELNARGGSQVDIRTSSQTGGSATPRGGRRVLSERRGSSFKLHL